MDLTEIVFFFLLVVLAGFISEHFILPRTLAWSISNSVGEAYWDFADWMMVWDEDNYSWVT